VTDLSPAPPTPRPQLTDHEAQRVAALIDRPVQLSLAQLAREIAALDDACISDATAALLIELLRAHHHGPAQPATVTALIGLLQPPGPAEEPEDWRTSRLLRAAATALTLGLHREENGWMIRVLLEDPHDVVAAEWEDLVTQLAELQRLDALLPTGGA